MPLPSQSLTVRNVIGSETIVFPFSSLPSATRQAFNLLAEGSPLMFTER